MAATSKAEQSALDDLAQNLADPMWRLCSGALYKIMVKKEGEEGEGFVMPFKPNRAQRRFIARLWNRNLILKARQLGFTTLIAIVWLDHALFNANQRCGIIAQDREAAEVIFRDKVKFAYDNLPPALKAVMPLARNSATELLFGHNNSSIRVATSMRSGTIHRLHISEFGKICAKYPDKAQEVVTGSIPAVPLDGILVIESTAEGREGEFYDITQRARALDQQGKELSQRDYRFHFFPWWQEPAYVMEPTLVVISQQEHEYFDQIKAKVGQAITPEQRAWYIATRNADFPNNEERMWQEYPSDPDEPFQVSTKGTYYPVQIARARKEKRFTVVPHVPGIPVNTFWDIGNSDGTAIWMHQRVGMRHHFIKFIEGWGEPYAHFVSEMQKLGWVWGRHYLPHDGAHVRQAMDVDSQISPEQALYKLGLRNIEIVPRVDELQHGIQMVRDVFSQCVFDEAGCKEGLVHLEMYRKRWNAQQQCWTDQPLKDIHTEGADSFRQFAQVNSKIPAGGPVQSQKRRTRNWRTA